MALNLLEGRENNFMNLTIYSHVQLTAAAYLQIVLALLIIPFLGKLLDTRKEYAAEYYQTRIETKSYGDREADDPCLCPDPDSNPGGDLFRDFLSERPE